MNTATKDAIINYIETTRDVLVTFYNGVGGVDRDYYMHLFQLATNDLKAALEKDETII